MARAVSLLSSIRMVPSPRHCRADRRHRHRSGGTGHASHSGPGRGGPPRPARLVTALPGPAPSWGYAGLRGASRGHGPEESAARPRTPRRAKPRHSRALKASYFVAARPPHQPGPARPRAGRAVLEASPGAHPPQPGRHPRGYHVGAQVFKPRAPRLRHRRAAASRPARPAWPIGPRDALSAAPRPRGHRSCFSS